MICNEPLAKYDFVIRSDDNQSHILFSFIDVELERMKSINYLVRIKDVHFAGQVDIWFEESMLKHFWETLVTAEHSVVKLIQLQAMSPEEFEMTFIHQTRGHYEVAYSIRKTKHLRSRLVETSLTGTFQYDPEFLIQLKESLKAISNLLS